MERLTKRNSAGYAIPQTGVKWEQILDRLAEIEDAEELREGAMYCDNTSCTLRQTGKPCPAAIGCQGHEEQFITMGQNRTIRQLIWNLTGTPCLTISEVERICDVLNDALNRMEQEDAKPDREVPCDGWSKWKDQTMAKFMGGVEMKIRLSMDGTSISVNAGEQAQNIFMDLARIFVEGGGEVNNEEEKREKLNAERPENTETEKERGENEGLRYKGFIFWKCRECGHVRGFCMKKESKGIHCTNCGNDSLFEKELRPIRMRCECGSSFRYMTNMEEEMFDIECLDCGSPVAVKWNEHKKIYENM